MNDLNTYDDIYIKIFRNIQHGNIDIFLCGAASTKEKISYRDALRECLKDNKQLSILYPEDMFMEILGKKKYDLLTLEKVLAQNCDLIIIVCESPGSFAELGAFVNNNETFEKVIVLLQTKFKNAKSFIRQGPVEYVKRKNKKNVIYFNNDISETVKEINKYIRWKFGPVNYRIRTRNYSFKDLNLISGQYYFITLLLYFYEKLDIKQLVQTIKRIYLASHYDENNFEIIYSAAVRRLFKDRVISKLENNQYTLTKKGYDFVNILLSYVSIDNKTKVFNKIRLEIMRNSLYY